ncbi:DUF1385 domain-containing protein [Thermosediminibacter oceani]|uniref:DUF1385 domain-containing protein n=1 Tax=Thermosediminibacter oceani (strain ATCC BAA-1034 / DSM 16646 / JW/IW-1228P) TaxID=555079 RepID=D9S011_THEOJ|nr:DUF1385 domain-containing protein [Thermosediminibacter oceani]ADL08788.1 protein of unknown function DUF1385 [Thermosediminibacter oceani DSM 16646]
MGRTKPTIGGQAVMEGVMMRSPKFTAIAVRKNDEIIVKKEENSSIADKYPVLKLPVLRGAVALIEMLVIGVRALSYSAGIVAGEEEELTGRDIFYAVALAIGFAVLLFIVVPTVLVKLIAGDVKSHLFLNLIEGLIRIAVFLLYLIFVSSMKDVRRFFEYHGAEHKAVYCYENGEELTVENARKYTTLHPRCGTSFLLVVMIVSILLFSLLGWPGILARITSRVLLFPLVAGISYEFIRLAGRSRSPIIKAISAPGMWLQKLTTREPDDSQLEVALEALKCVLSGGDTLAG